jgi:Trypsin-like peptidase domain
VTMNLSEYVNSNVESDGGAWLEAVGPAARTIHYRTGREELTRPLVASTFWQSYVNSSAFAKDLQSRQLSKTDVRAGEPLVVYHPGPSGERYTLLLFASKLTSPRSFPVEITAQQLRDGWDRANRRRLAAARRSSTLGMNSARMRTAYALNKRVAIEALRSERFYVLVVPPVEEEVTSVPTPALGVDVGVAQSGPTAGVIVRDAVGRIAVTTAAHAIPRGSEVRVAGLPASVIQRVDDDKYDCCVLEVQPFSFPPAHRPSHGPLKLAPRMNVPVTFEGMGSGSVVTTFIRAFNIELPYIDPNLQQTVRTDLVTSRGDSGAALVDNEGYIVGLAYSRSAPNAAYTYSAWIWAEAVFQKLGLVAY